MAACAAALVAGSFAPPGPAAPVLFCTLLGIGLALVQSPGLHPHLDRCEQSAPLFGRELARAKALVPCVARGARGVRLRRRRVDERRGRRAGGVARQRCPPCWRARSSRFRRRSARGAARLLYVLLAVATSAAAYALAVAARSVLAELALCAIVAFLALRQYGEALARYDPI